MTPVRRQLALRAFKLFDLVTMVFCFAMATAAVYQRVGPNALRDFLAMQVKMQNLVAFLSFFLIWHLSFSSCRLYRSRRLSKRWDEIVDVIKATTIGTTAIFMAAAFFRIAVISPAFVAFFWVASTVMSILSRLVLRWVLKKLRLRGRNLRFAIIVGTNPRALNFAREIETKPGLGYRLIGFVDDNWHGLGEFYRTPYLLVADCENLNAFLKNNVVDEVFIALPLNSSYEKASRILASCEEHGIIVRYVSDIFNHKLASATAEEFAGIPVIALYNGTMQGWRVHVKRMLDICLSLVLLLLCLPLFLVAAPLVKLSSPGPVFFSQTRIGLNKRRFRLYKFRTMIKGAETILSELETRNEASGPVFKIKDDPRITSIGRILRRTSIDELPQLLNVLKGHMSLVGPRPLPERDYERFSQNWHRRRFSVRPGITCLWQVNGRSTTAFDKWMELDMQYIDKWSLWLDMKILAHTIPAVLKGKGAV